MANRPLTYGRRLPCTRAELEALRAVMFALFAAAERDPNAIRGCLLCGYVVELAQLLAGERGLQRRFYYWHRQARRLTVGYRASRPPRRRRRPSGARRRTRAVDIPGIYRWRR